MLAKEYRLDRQSFQKVYKKARTLVSPFFRVYYLPTASHRRLACVVSTKVERLAVNRNLLRRRVYEAVRHTWPHLIPEFELILFAKTDLKGKSYAKIETEIKNIWTRLNTSNQ